MNLRHIAISTVFSVLIITFLLGTDFWKEKESSTWSINECNRILTKSPWAFSDSFGRATYREGLFHCRLISAKPIRLAMIRLGQIQNPNDEAMKFQMDKELTIKPEERILIQISYQVEPGMIKVFNSLHSFFGRAHTGHFRGNTLLSSSEGVFVPLSEYRPWTTSRPNPVFVFPRFDENGDLYFTGKEEVITLRSEFSVPTSGRNYRIFITMNPKDMWYQGEFEL